VRTQSGIGRGAVSHGLATVQLIQESKINLKNALITIIGVNKLTEDTIKFLQNKGAEAIFVANRSYEKAKPYADKFNCKIFDFTNLMGVLSFTDILICATSAPHTVIKKENFPQNKEMLIFDLAFPRDVDVEIAQYTGVKLLNLDNVEQTINQNLQNRNKEVELAEAIIDEEIKKYNLLSDNKPVQKLHLCQSMLSSQSYNDTLL
jgi:glutamyl-tRNA reductase